MQPPRLFPPGPESYFLLLRTSGKNFCRTFPLFPPRILLFPRCKVHIHTLIHLFLSPISKLVIPPPSSSSLEEKDFFLHMRIARRTYDVIKKYREREPSPCWETTPPLWRSTNKRAFAGSKQAVCSRLRAQGEPTNGETDERGPFRG